MKDKIRPIYGELIGYLSQAPLAKEGFYSYESALWTQLNNVIDKLSKITQEDLNRFKVTTSNDGSEFRMSINEYRIKLNGLIMYLQKKYFNDETPPFGGQPSTIVNQNQSQSVQISMILEFQSFIDKKLYSKKLEEKERSFLNKIKDSLSTVKSMVELVNLILTTAQNFGLDINQITKIFK